MKPLFDKIFGTVTKFIVKHSVEICMGGAVIGVAAIVYTTNRATLKVDKVIKDENLTKKEKVKKSVVPTAPVAASVIFTLASIGGMYYLGKKKQAALLGLLMSTTNVFNAYRANQQKQLGKAEELKQYDAAVVESNNLNDKVPDVPKLENEVIFCEAITGQWFTGTKSNFWASAYAINGAYHEYGMVGFNQWLQYLGCDEDEQIDDCGWTYEGGQYYGYSNIEVGLVKHRSASGKEYYLITYTTLPHSMFLMPYDKGCADEDLVLIPFYDTELWNNCSQGEIEGIIEHDVSSLHPRK